MKRAAAIAASEALLELIEAYRRHPTPEAHAALIAALEAFKKILEDQT
jgi:hypothetical protein